MQDVKCIRPVSAVRSIENNLALVETHSLVLFMFRSAKWTNGRKFSSDRITEGSYSRKILWVGITEAGYSKTRRVPCPRGRKTGLTAVVDRSPFKSVIYLADGNYIDSKSGTPWLRTREVSKLTENRNQ